LSIFRIIYNPRFSITDFSSRRQYIHQFEKWCFNKYNTNVATPEFEPAENRPLLLQHPLHTGNEQPFGGSGCSQMSILLRQPMKHPQSLREKPPVPLKKRKILADYLSPNDPYAHLGLAFDAPEVPPSSSQSRVQDAETADPLREMSIWSGKRADGVVDTTPCMLVDDDCGTVSSDTSDISMVPSSDSPNFWGLVDFEQLQSQHPGDISSRQEIQIDSNRPIDTFSPNEIDNMKRAADFLKCLHCTEDAFALYILILKRLKDSTDQPAWSTTSAMISCVQCAKTLPHIEIARSLLQQSLNESRSSVTNVEKYLFQMLLAQTYVRMCEDDAANSHIKFAMSADFANKNLITFLPREYRTLDILTYHYLTGGLVSRLNHEPLAYATQFASKLEVQQILIRHEPGPFELKDGSMKNPCLRSCLQWCTSELGLEPSVSGSWELVKTNRKNDAFAAELTAIYCCLWERSQSRETEHKSTTCVLWIDQTERLMGISAAELLRTVCSMIISASSPGKAKSERDFVRRTYLGATSLSQHTDEMLGCQFLDRFSYLKGLYTAPNTPRVFDKVRRAYAKDFIEKKLWIRLPRVVTEALKASTPRQSLEIVAAAFLPTLASSLHSSELAPLRMIGDRMQRNVRDAMQGVAMTISSRVSKASPRSNRSFPTISMSELSQALSSSLSLSSIR
jgi:hypothetical protein